MSEDIKDEHNWKEARIPMVGHLSQNCNPGIDNNILVSERVSVELASCLFIAICRAHASYRQENSKDFYSRRINVFFI
jgi:hypothetical protein